MVRFLSVDPFLFVLPFRWGRRLSRRCRFTAASLFSLPRLRRGTPRPETSNFLCCLLSGSKREGGRFKKNIKKILVSSRDMTDPGLVLNVIVVSGSLALFGTTELIRSQDLESPPSYTIKRALR